MVYVPGGGDGLGDGDVFPGGNGLGVVVVGLELPHPAVRLAITNSHANLTKIDVSTG
jgi:hypothetical protein